MDQLTESTNKEKFEENPKFKKEYAEKSKNHFLINKNGEDK